MRRVGGFTAQVALSLARAERWSSDSGLELQYEIGRAVATLVEKRPTEERGQEGWDRQGWEFSEPLVFMPTPKGVPERVVAAILALRLWQPVVS